VGARLGEANVLLSLGDLLRAQGQMPEARAHYDAALQRYEFMGDRYSQARVHYRLGDWYAVQEQWADAITRYETAIGLWQDIGLRDLVTQILTPRLAEAKQHLP
jgi:tetratricopeptide (TPR) repeat protein